MKNQFVFFSTILLCCFLSIKSISQSSETDTSSTNYPKALVSFSDFKNLMDEVESHRYQRLISLDTFLKMSEDPNTIILDTRSKDKFMSKHIKGAINLPFTEFTQRNLDRLIKDKNARILIYCNNNFDGDQVYFASKTSSTRSEFAPFRKPIMLALNIPTYLNLYGYGFKNVYELNELVHVKDQRIKFEGRSVPIVIKNIISLKKN